MGENCDDRVSDPTGNAACLTEGTHDTISVLVGENVAAPTQDVLAGRATAHMIDPTTFTILKAQNPDLASKVKLLNDEDNLLKPVGLSYAVRPTDLHMLNFLNVYIQDRINNGTYKALRDKWFTKLGEAK